MIASFSPAATEDAAKNLSDEFSLRYSLFQGSVKNIRTTLSVFLSQHKTSLLDLRIQMEPFGRRKSAQIRYVQSLARGPTAAHDRILYGPQPLAGNASHDTQISAS